MLRQFLYHEPIFLFRNLRSQTELCVKPAYIIMLQIKLCLVTTSSKDSAQKIWLKCIKYSRGQNIPTELLYMKYKLLF